MNKLDTRAKLTKFCSSKTTHFRSQRDLNHSEKGDFSELCNRKQRDLSDGVPEATNQVTIGRFVHNWHPSLIVLFMIEWPGRVKIMTTTWSTTRMGRRTCARKKRGVSTCGKKEVQAFSSPPGQVLLPYCSITTASERSLLSIFLTGRTVGKVLLVQFATRGAMLVDKDRSESYLGSQARWLPYLRLNGGAREMGKEGEDSWGDPWIHFPLGGRIWLTPCKASGGGLEWRGGNAGEISSQVHLTLHHSPQLRGHRWNDLSRIERFVIPHASTMCSHDFWHSSCWVNTMVCILLGTQMFQSRNDQHDAKMKDGLMWWTLGVAPIHQVWPWTNPEALTTCDNIFIHMWIPNISWSSEEGAIQ